MTNYLKPIEGQTYWNLYIGEEGYFLEKAAWTNDRKDKKLYKSGNCFPTRKLAQAKLKQILALLKI